jgi:3-hydroxyacyl-CoA dehydrogenase/enoyl-CoA hydratase/3-hydroxybutyryl-CoA epimerase
MTEMIRWDSGADGIVVLTIDDPAQSANTINADYAAAMQDTLDRLTAVKDDIAGVVITSAKKTFVAGGDLTMMLAATSAQAQQIYDFGMRLKAQFRALETLGTPVVAALNGSALGGGLEVALACHHRIAADVPGAKFGMPEVTLGLLPGGGGVVRTVRMFGIADALTKILLQGRQYRVQDALRLGLIDEVVDGVDDLLPAARAWIKAHSDAIQPWDVTGYKIPGGNPASPAFAASLPAFPANLRKQLKGAHYPAPRAIMAAAVEGAQVDIDTAGQIEARYMTELVTGQIAKNMMKAFFFDLQKVNSGASRPTVTERFEPATVGVIGAGMMGAGIAYVCAAAGLAVVLKDVTIEAAEHGKYYAAQVLDGAVGKNRSTREQADATLGLIRPTAATADLAGCDLVIEAVFEEPRLKGEVYAELQQVLAADAVIATNTSTLPISELAAGVKRPENFVGLHFFSPVDKMPLLEIIAGAQTSDATVAKAFDLAGQIRKTPILVNDSRGFFTSRVIGTFINEAIAMVGAGVAPASVEQAALQAGYPVAPLQLADELDLTLLSRIQHASEAGTVAEGKVYQRHPAFDLIETMVAKGRAGKRAGAGFYDYADGGRTGLWQNLTATLAGAGETGQVPFEDLQERMLFAEAIESVRCLDEGVLRTVEDANIGSLLGIGFPGWTGGVLQYINGYQGGTGRSSRTGHNGQRGPVAFVVRARDLAARYGERFRPPDSLVQLAQDGNDYR